ncbi:MAG: precorrin-3B C(17)-methyltransferase [Nitratireductor sp.]
MKKPVVVVISKSGYEVGYKIATSMNATLYGLEGRTNKPDVLFSKTKQTLQGLFNGGTPIIAVMASGALVRMLAPVLKDKHKEPPVIAVSEDGSAIVPLLGGHHGANDIARELSQSLGGVAAITTAGDLRFGIALDEPPQGYVLANPENAKTIMAELLAGEKVEIIGDADFLSNSKLPISQDAKSAKYKLIVADEPIAPDEVSLVYYKQNLMLGMGCERSVGAQEAIDLVSDTLAQNNLSIHQLAGLYSIDLKADETALHVVGQHFNIPVRFFDAQTLELEKPRLQNPSDYVFKEVGCHGVAEGAALAASGKDGELIVPKQKTKRVTLAIAKQANANSNSKIMTNESKKMVDNSRKRGKLFVVGIGPGKQDWRSPEVSHMIGASTDLVGYSLYLDLIADISQGKKRHDFDLGKEEDRVRHSMELAGEGKDVALVCSGDAGIYAMATLVFELLQNGGLSDAASRIEIVVSPGISALQAAAAKTGAPLGHDFCTISLSDLLTPWDAIKMRIKAASEGDFVIAFYNPVSKRRRTQLAHAKEVLLEHRPTDTPVILASNLGRDEEAVKIVPLSELNIDDVDMLTVVIVGSSETKTVKTGDGKTWIYTPRGYSAKVGTKIGQDT